MTNHSLTWQLVLIICLGYCILEGHLKSAEIWGPFPNAGAAKQVMKLLRREFGLRDDKNNIPFGYVDHGSDEDYKQRISAVRQILNGNATKLIEDLTIQMDVHSEKIRVRTGCKEKGI